VLRLLLQLTNNMRHLTGLWCVVSVLVLKVWVLC